MTRDEIPFSLRLTAGDEETLARGSSWRVNSITSWCARGSFLGTRRSGGEEADEFETREN